MKSHIEKVFVISGNAHCYQFIVIGISMLIWAFTTVFSCSLAFLEMQPTVTITSPPVRTVPLTYEICEDTSLLKTINKDRIQISWTNELGIECEKLKTSLIGTVTSLGYLCGAVLSSTLNSLFGERKTLLGSMVLFILVLLGSIFISNYYYYCFTTFACCLCSNVSSYIGMILLNEIIDQKKKAIFSIFIYCGMGSGGIIFYGLFTILDNWRHVMFFAIGMTIIIIIAIAIFLIDSPMKAINNNDFVTFISLMRFVAKINGKLMTFDLEVGTERYLRSFKRLFGDENANEYSVIIESFVRTTVPTNALNESLINRESRAYFQKKQQEMAVTTKTIRESKPQIKREPLITSIFKYKSVRTTFLLFCLFWFSTSCLSSGLAINIKSLGGNMTVNGILLYSVDIIGYIVSGFLINTQTFGRKGSLMLFSGGISGSLFLYAIFIKNSTFSLVFYIIARFFIMSALCIYYTFALESYPTSIKTIAYSLNGACNSFGGMVVPFIIEYIEAEIVFYGFAALFCGVTALMYLLKETIGKPPRDEIIEVETNYEDKKEIALKYDLSEIMEVNVE